jgi:xanthine dehydrogenase accessory factor
MNKALIIWQLILKSLQQNHPVMLLYVLESKGSSPGRQGFFMAVNASGEMEGSIGGGIMEHKFVELAKEKLKYEEVSISIRKQVHDKQAATNQSGMICSGEQTVLLYHVQPKEMIPIQQIVASLQQNGYGLLELKPSGISFSAQISPEHDYLFSYQSESDWFYQEKTGYKNHLYIVGAGHCALALSKVMRMFDFYIHLYDDRPGLKTFLQNKYADEKVVLHSYNDLKNVIPSGNNHYVVIMTFGYRTDDVAIRALIHKNFKYCGVLGSSKKIEKMFSDYQKEGISPDLLNRMYAPVGLPIHSQTPEEIAVSIAAQIIEIKNRKEASENTVQQLSKVF